MGIGAAAAAARTSPANRLGCRPSSRRDRCRIAAAAGTASHRSPRSHKPPHQHQGRKKKKFFQKSSAPPAQPGNSISGPPQGKRRGRQKGPRAFVGPMDHSYRAVNGNVADGPPSTIPTAGNGHSSGYYPDVYSAQPPAPIREDAPTRIFCFIEDLFFLAKIQETARKLGVKVEFVKGETRKRWRASASRRKTRSPRCWSST